MTVVYVDSVFLLNGAMDYLLLLCTARLAGLRLRRGRYALAAVLGLVGAGGLGTPLLFAMNGYLWPQAAAYLLGLLVLVLISGALADRSRRRKD